MHEKKSNKTRAATALFLCFCVVALTSFLAVKTSLDKINEYSSSNSETRTNVSENQKAAAQTPIVDSKSKESASSGSNSNTSEQTDSSDQYIVPIEGAVILKYSMDGLVYSKTLDQYMTHPGIDISGQLSSEVVAIADGTVSKVYNDDRYGMTICIAHDDGLVSVYSNLAKQGLSETGDSVSQGQPIGCIGDTALFESLDESHLHFELLKDGNPCDPGEYINAFKK